MGVVCNFIFYYLFTHIILRRRAAREVSQPFAISYHFPFLFLFSPLFTLPNSTYLHTFTLYTPVHMLDSVYPSLSSLFLLCLFFFCLISSTIPVNSHRMKYLLLPSFLIPPPLPLPTSFAQGPLVQILLLFYPTMNVSIQ
jgi:hypothetical protein